MGAYSGVNFNSSNGATGFAGLSFTSTGATASTTVGITGVAPQSEDTLLVRTIGDYNVTGAQLVNTYFTGVNQRQEIGANGSTPYLHNVLGDALATASTYRIDTVNNGGATLMNSAYNSTVIFALRPDTNSDTTPRIIRRNISSGNGVSTASIATGALPMSGGVYFLINIEDGTTTVSSIASASFTATRVAQTTGTNQRVELWSAFGNNSSQTYTVTLSNTAQFHIEFLQFSASKYIVGTAVNHGTSTTASNSITTTAANSYVLANFLIGSTSGISYGADSSGTITHSNRLLSNGSNPSNASSSGMIRTDPVISSSGTSVTQTASPASSSNWTMMQIAVSPYTARTATIAAGTFTLSGGLARPSWGSHRSGIGTFVIGGHAIPMADSIVKDSQEKTYLYKVYDHDGSFLGQWNDVVSDFGYSQQINSAGSSIDVTLARNSDSLSVSYDSISDDSFDPIETDDDNEIAAETTTQNSIGPGTNVDLNLDVKIYEFTKDDIDLSGTLVFSGYISQYISQYGSQEQTKVSLFSYGADMDNWVLEDEDGNTRFEYLTQDPSDILRDVLDRFGAVGGLNGYDGTTIEDTSTTVSYTFNVNTAFEVLQKCLTLAPTDWFYYVDLATSKVNFHPRPTTPTHYFYLGKHILSLNLQKSIETMQNLVYFTGGQVSTDMDGNPINLFKKYEDDTSITNFRRGLDRLSDNRVILEDSADIIVDSEISRGSQPRYTSSIVLSNSVYDIRSIKLGDLIGFRNFNNFVDSVTMQVVQIAYTPDSVSLQLDTLLPSVPKRLDDIKRNLAQSDVADNPDAPST